MRQPYLASVLRLARTRRGRDVQMTGRRAKGSILGDSRASLWKAEQKTGAYCRERPRNPTGKFNCQQVLWPNLQATWAFKPTPRKHKYALT